MDLKISKFLISTEKALSLYQIYDQGQADEL